MRRLLLVALTIAALAAVSAPALGQDDSQSPPTTSDLVFDLAPDLVSDLEDATDDRPGDDESPATVAELQPPDANPPPPPPPVCRVLKVTAELRAQLRAAHRRQYQRSFNGPPRRGTYYGRCRTTFYALASFNHPRVGYTDQPEAFRRRLGHRWVDLGDTGGDVCGSRKVPMTLVKLWGIKCL